MHRLVSLKKGKKRKNRSEYLFVNFGISAHNLIVLKFFFYIQNFRSKNEKFHKSFKRLMDKIT